MPPPLDSSVIDAIFARLFGLYGSLWTDRTGGANAQGRAATRSAWAAALGRFAPYPEAIRAALEECSELQYPPTAPEFVALVRNHVPRAPAVALPPPRGPVEFSGPHAKRLRAEFAKLSAYRPDDLLWAKQCRTPHQMRLLCAAITENREVHRLLPILLQHVRNGTPTVDAKARAIAAAHRVYQTEREAAEAEIAARAEA